MQRIGLDRFGECSSDVINQQPQLGDFNEAFKSTKINQNSAKTAKLVSEIKIHNSYSYFSQNL